jgi:hypothetical protein
MRREALTVDPGGDLRGAPRDDTWQRWPGLVDDFDSSFIGGLGDVAHSEVDDLEALGNTSSPVTVGSLEEYTSNASEAERTWTKTRGQLCIRGNVQEYSAASARLAGVPEYVGKPGHKWRPWKHDRSLGWRLCDLRSTVIENCKKLCLTAGNCAQMYFWSSNRCCFPSKKRHCSGHRHYWSELWKHDTLAEMALKKAAASLAKADQARSNSGKALNEADKALRKQKDQHKLVLAAQAKAEEAHRQARAAGSNSSRALKQAKTASGEAHNSLSKAQQAENHTEKLRHVVDAQKHTLRTLNHTMDGLRFNVDRVDRMQSVDERLLNVTSKTTLHLAMGLEHQKKTTATLRHMQEFDNSTYEAINRTIEAMQHAFAEEMKQSQETISKHQEDISKHEEEISKHEEEMTKHEEEIEEAQKEQEALKSEQKVLKVVSWSTVSAVLLFLGQKAFEFATKFLADRAKKVAFSKYKELCDITISIRSSDGTTLFGPEIVPGHTQLGEIISRMQPPPDRHRWEILSANVALDPEVRVGELGEGDTFVLTATSVHDGPPAMMDSVSSSPES